MESSTHFPSDLLSLVVSCLSAAFVLQHRCTTRMSQKRSKNIMLWLCPCRREFYLALTSLIRPRFTVSFVVVKRFFDSHRLAGTTPSASFARKRRSDCRKPNQPRDYEEPKHTVGHRRIHNWSCLSTRQAIRVERCNREKMAVLVASSRFNPSDETRGSIFPS
jgi:hypothetical protein